MDSQTEETVEAPVDLSDGCPFCGNETTANDDTITCGSCLARFTGTVDHAYPLWGPFGSNDRIESDAISVAFVDSVNDGQWLSAEGGYFDDEMR